ncbi:hypothetical protein HY625_02260 [Candidatus Uhrbacteria bacterium]|nr:hypothetical protein [Candidatus Uhrbacteria bacterium]
MLPQKQFQQAIATANALDEKSLEVLEEAIDQYLRDEPARMDALKKKKEQIKNLRTAIKERDQRKIAELQAQLHTP